MCGRALAEGVGFELTVRSFDASDEMRPLEAVYAASAATAGVLPVVNRGETAFSVRPAIALTMNARNGPQSSLLKCHAGLPRTGQAAAAVRPDGSLTLLESEPPEIGVAIVRHQ